MTSEKQYRHALLLFLTSRIPETEPYRSDRFEIAFGLATVPV
jgi:hypothetical protein